MNSITESILYVDCWFDDTFKCIKGEEEEEFGANFDWYYHACVMPEEIDSK